MFIETHKNSFDDIRSCFIVKNIENYLFYLICLFIQVI
ncbi:hypothetical protein SGODD07_01374 [Streptococcus gordonii]|uniref:Uncharacterized protein n=1 Tax=Streptococcus gordonii TaxID=1302 RepID=A0A139N5V9_STRGN|nr:hypothetical protein SGODD07_01374 [Streptococcus gordonii]